MEASHPLVAVVDDEPAVCKALGRLLRSYGYRVQSFGSGQEFLDSLVVARPDCLILDIHMPGMDGLEIRHTLQKQGVSLPVIFVTANDDPELPARVQNAGVAGFLHKPFGHHELLAVLFKVLEERRPLH